MRPTNRHRKPFVSRFKQHRHSSWCQPKFENLESRQLLAVTLSPIGTYSTGLFDEGGAEIVAHDPDSQRLFVTNVHDRTVDVLDISDVPNTPPNLLFQIDTSGFANEPTSVDVSDGVLAVAVRNELGATTGAVAFFDTDGAFIHSVEVGSGPDMLTFTPDGTKVLVANQGRPSVDYESDPMGSVSIIDVSGGPASAIVSTADFSSFDGQEDALRDEGVRIYGPIVVNGEIVGAAPASRDLEPEYIAVSADSSTAWVTLQENNAIAVLNIDGGQFEDVKPLGYKNHRAHGNGLDASDKDDAINIERSRVRGMYQPDGVAAYVSDGEVFLLTANEGASRDEDIFNEESRVKDLTVTKGLEQLQADEQLGRLQVTTVPPSGKHVGNDGEPVFSQLYAFGTRSFSIWNEDIELVYDSGDDFEQVTANQFPDHFNANDANEFDDGELDNFEQRSDNKGPEPETVVVGEVGNSKIAFVGLERMGGVMVYDVSDPHAPEFQSYVNRRDFTAFNTIDVNGQEITNPAVGDLAVEGLAFISASDSPTGTPLLVTANEVSGTTTVFAVMNANQPVAAVAIDHNIVAAKDHQESELFGEITNSRMKQKQIARGKQNRIAPLRSAITQTLFESERVDIVEHVFEHGIADDETWNEKLN